MCLLCSVLSTLSASVRECGKFRCNYLINLIICLWWTPYAVAAIIWLIWLFIYGKLLYRKPGAATRALFAGCVLKLATDEKELIEYYYCFYCHSEYKSCFSSLLFLRCNHYHCKVNLYRHFIIIFAASISRSWQRASVKETEPETEIIIIWIRTQWHTYVIYIRHMAIQKQFSRDLPVLFENALTGWQRHWEMRQ